MSDPPRSAAPRLWVVVDDEELSALALAAPAEALAPDAVPIGEVLGEEPLLLSPWYMAPLRARTTGSRWRRGVVVAIVATLIVLEALGLCSAFGQVVAG